MIQTWTDIARGPLLWAALAFMVLGLLRLVAVTAIDLARVVCRAGDRSVRWRAAAAATVKWLIPLGKARNRPLYSLTTIALHVSILVVPVFLAGHVALIRRGTGLSWPAIPNALADVLTLVAVATAVAAVVQRALARDSRYLSRFQDYAIPLVVAVPFVTGFLVMHPAWNPFSFDAVFLAHALSGNLVMILIPLTKLSHVVLMPAAQFVSEASWHFPPDAGSRVAAALGRDRDPV